MKTKVLSLSIVVVLGILVGIVTVVRPKPEKPVKQKTSVSEISEAGVSFLPEPKKATFEDALNSITEEELKKDLYYLASDELEGRMSGKKGNCTAAEFIKAKYESFGLPAMYHQFHIRRENPGPKNEQGDDFTQNIYAWIQGNDPELRNEVVVIGAHMDHIGWGPAHSRARTRHEIHHGADDNASGTVALLEIAQALSMVKHQVKRTIVFQSYSAEEMGLIGSRYYCDNPIFPTFKQTIRPQDKLKYHVAMINMDMIGYLKRGYYFSGFDAGNSSVDLGRIINDLDGKYSFAKSITSRGGGGSDHASFYNKKIPVAFLHTGLHKNYHTPDDTADKINYPGLTQIAKYAFELTWQVANGPAPKFNDVGFKPLPYDHDHGDPEVKFSHEH